jgi:hypothetical protein
MKRLLILLLFSTSFTLSAQVVNFPKTLPERAWSIGLSPAYHFDNNVIAFDAGGASIALNGGYGILYSLDVNARYIYFFNGADYIGVDAQYLIYETRKSYISTIAGLHYWDVVGMDLSAFYTFTPRYEFSFSIGLDMDLSFAQDLNPRFWIPLNVGYNPNEMMFIYAEYKLPVADLSWGILALGINMILR